MSGRNKARRQAAIVALSKIRGQAQIETSSQLERWLVIMQAVIDLAPNRFRMDNTDYPADLYFQGPLFREDAHWCHLDPEWVLYVLEKYELLVDGKRVPEMVAQVA